MLSCDSSCLSSVDFFSKLTFCKNSFRNSIRTSNSLAPDQALQSLGLLGPICLPRLSADETGKKRINQFEQGLDQDIWQSCVFPLLLSQS